MTHHQSPHVPLVSRKVQDRLREARTAYDALWRGKALNRLEEAREASATLLAATLHEVAPQATSSVPTHVVERYADYRPYQAKDMTHW